MLFILPLDGHIEKFQDSESVIELEAEMPHCASFIRSFVRDANVTGEKREVNFLVPKPESTKAALVELIEFFLE